MHIIIYGDQHYNLKTEGIDRTDDIDNSHNQIIDYAINLKDKGEDVICLNMGDTFHGTNPRSDVIARVIRTFNRLEKAEIETHIIAGNHDVVDQRDRTSALAPIEAFDYKYIKVHHTILCIGIRKGLNIITLPHISRAFAISQGYKGVQDFINAKSFEIDNNLSENEYNIVIGHMNIEGAKTGTETYMIKGSHEDFPKIFKESKNISYIFNGHIHRSQLIDNDGAPIIITGDISCNDFGERLDTKVFFDLELNLDE